MVQDSSRWGKLDNTAHLFPAISTKRTTNVFRQSVVLNETVEPLILQLALEKVIKLFPAFKVRLRTGFFWYYLEENLQKLPLVKEETDYPCTQLPQPSDKGYLFRISSWKNRINVEFFHVLTDGTGAEFFLQELVFHYLAILYPHLANNTDVYLGENTSLNRDDSFFNNFNHPLQKKQSSKKTTQPNIYHCTGEEISYPRFSVIHGYCSLAKLKHEAKKKNATINQYLTALYIWCFYKEQIAQGFYSKEIAIAIPVNLRPWFGSITTKNFFVMAFAKFLPTTPSHTLEDILISVQESLSKEISKEKFESTLGWNVSNEKSIIKALVPLRLKNIGIRYVYKRKAAKATSTASNFGSLNAPEKFAPYIQAFHGILPVSYKQPIRAVFASYQDTFCITFSSVLETTFIQQKFFSFLTECNIPVTLETNGEHSGNM